MFFVMPLDVPHNFGHRSSEEDDARAGIPFSILVPHMSVRTLSLDKFNTPKPLYTAKKGVYINVVQQNNSTDLVTLNRGQMVRMTPLLSLHSSDIHTTST
ncbi:hypothetical protein TNCV_172631 [Trichonephila clavipes]|nr:hypothetical protein TNCV_172631 [Trichonephila clavipes]